MGGWSSLPEERLFILIFTFVLHITSGGIPNLLFVTGFAGKIISQRINPLHTPRHTPKKKVESCALRRHDASSLGGTRASVICVSTARKPNSLFA